MATTEICAWFDDASGVGAMWVVSKMVDGDEVECLTPNGFYNREEAVAVAIVRAKQLGVRAYSQDRITGDEATEWTPPSRCECCCGEDSTECGEVATVQEDGRWLCSECADYYLLDDEVVCSRQQDRVTCRHCGKKISWGSIQTGQPGDPNSIEGHCACRDWTQIERGSRWELAEGDEWPIVELCDYSRFETAGADQGQIVLVSYAWADGDLIRRREDQSEKPGSVDRVTYSVARDAIEEDGLGEGSTVDDWAAAGLDWERCSVRE